MYDVKSNNGITLIALVITIIVLLILAGVSINAVVGENGVATKAKLAAEKTHIGSDQESTDLAMIGYKTEDISGNSSDIVEYLENYNEDWNVEVTDGVLTINVESCGHSYSYNLDEVTNEQSPEMEEDDDIVTNPEDSDSNPVTVQYLADVAVPGTYVNYYGNDDIEEYSWIVLDVDTDTKIVKLVRSVCWYDKMTTTPTTVEEHNTMANETVRENNKYFNADFVESENNVTALSVADVKKNNGDEFEWMGKVKNSYLVVNQTVALVGESGYEETVYAIMSNGQIGYYALGTHYVRAVVELKANVIVTGGTGGATDKYQISLSE